MRSPRVSIWWRLPGAGEGNGDRVYLDDKLIIDDWTTVRAFEPHLDLQLAAGMHKVVVESWQGSPIGGKLRFGIVREDQVVNDRARAMAAQADVVIVAAARLRLDTRLHERE